MKNKPFFLLAVCLLLSANGMADFGKEDHLEPVNGYLEQLVWYNEYYAKIQSILFKGLSDFPECRFFVRDLPTESVLQIERRALDGSGIKFDLVYKRAKQSIWGTKDTSNIQVDTWRNGISSNDVNVIASLFRQAIAGVKFPEVPIERNYNNDDYNLGSMRLDGTYFYFTYNEHYYSELRSGFIWSPNEGTKMRRLVDVALKLTGLIRSDNGTVVLPDELKTTIVNLTNELKNSAR